MEKVAIPIWDERVSPVLDTATCLAIYDIDGQNEPERELVNIPHTHFTLIAKYIAQLKVDTVLCGALSRPMRSILISRGINVFPWVTGEVTEIVQAYQNGRLSDERFILPGRNCRRRCRKGIRGRGYFSGKTQYFNNDQEET